MLASRFPLRVPPLALLAIVALALVASYLIASAEVVQLLSPPDALRVLSSGPTAGWPAGAFVRAMIAPGLLSLVLGVLAARGAVDRLGPLFLGPVRRVVLANAPLLAVIYTVTQDDPMRRGALTSLAFGLATALGAYFGLGDRDDLPAPNTLAPKGTPWLERLRPHAAVLLVILVHAVVFSYLPIRRDRALWSATVDLGIFKEALWNTLHGHGVLYSPTVGYSFLGEHFSPVLFLLLPFYAVSPSSETLLLAQTLGISAAAWPLYRLGLANGLGRGLSAFVAGAMLFAPGMQHSIMYDFHMDLLGVPCLAWAIYAAHERKWKTLAIAAALLCSVKEEAFVSLTGLALATYLADKERRWRAPLVLLVAVLTYCGLAIAVGIKHFGPPPGVPVYMGGSGEGYKFLRNFSHFSGPMGPIGKPVRFVVWAFSDARLSAVFVLFAPLLMAPVFAGARLFLLTPLAILLLSDNADVTEMRYHYGAMQQPGVYAAGVYGMATWLRWTRSERRHALRRGLQWGVAAATIVLLGAHPGSEFAVTNHHDQRHVTERVRAVDREVIARVPADEPVSASSFGGPRFSNRPEIYMFPQNLERARWAFVDLQRPAWPSDFRGRDETVLSMLHNEWSAVSWAGGAIALTRGGDRARNREAVRDLFLRRTYEIEGTEQTDFPHVVEADANASDGFARVVRPTDPRSTGQWVVFGPYLRLPAGRFRVTFRLRGEPTWFRGEIGTVDVFASGRTLASHRLDEGDFPDGAWHDVNLEFQSMGMGGLEFRVQTGHAWVLGADKITVTPLDDENALLTAFGF